MEIRSYYDKFIKLGEDIAENQKCNREVMDFSDLIDLKKVLDPVKNKSDLEFISLVEDWVHYFDTGYKAKHSIDYLPLMIKRRMEKYALECKEIV